MSSTVSINGIKNQALDGVLNQPMIGANPFNSGRVIYGKSLYAATTDFTVVGTAPTVVSNGLQFTQSSGVNLDASALVLTSPAFVSASYDIETYWQANTAGANGIYLGRYSANAFSNVFLINPFVSGGNQSINFYNTAAGSVGSPVASTNVTTFLNNGDFFRFTFSQRGSTVRIRIENFTNGAIKQFYVPSNLQPGSSINFNPPSTGQIKLGCVGGTFTLMGLRVIERQPYRPFLAILGDSKSMGVGAGSATGSTPYGLGYGRQLPFGPTALYAGDGDISGWIQPGVAEMLQSNPQNVLIELGCNDIRNSVASGTWQANLAAIATTCQNAGATVYSLVGPQENSGGGGVDLSTLMTWQNANMPNPIDTRGVWNTSTMLASDGIHPNPYGYQVLANLIASQAAFSALPSTRFDAQESDFAVNLL